jgi:hypothetical protein
MSLGRNNNGAAMGATELAVFYQDFTAGKKFFAIFAKEKLHGWGLARARHGRPLYTNP